MLPQIPKIMKVQTITQKFEAKGLKVTKSINTGNVVVTAKNRMQYTFRSYNEAYRYFFN